MESHGSEETDVLLIGAGIFSATLAALLIRADPSVKIQVVERLSVPGEEASGAWNNAGTGHAGLCELNYTPQQPSGEISVAKALTIYEQFLHTQLFWSALREDGALGDPRAFINPTPHMGFVRGAEGAAFLNRRHEALTRHHFFSGMDYAESISQIAQWAPLLSEGREEGVPVAATFSEEGTDVDYGSVARQLFHDLTLRGGNVRTGQEVTDLIENDDASWTAVLDHGDGSGSARIRARRVFVGAGGWTLKLLRRAGLRAVRGYGLLPVSGTFLATSAEHVTGRHRVKVYGKAPTGAPPMSMPHMDARVIDGQRSVLFGPFAGAAPTFLKQGSPWDFVQSIRPDNAWRVGAMGTQNLNLVALLLRDLTKSHEGRVKALRAFMPSAEAGDWHLRTAGQRAQIVKPHPRKGGALTFGTEVVAASNGTIAGVLGASPGASTAVPIAVEVLERMFPEMSHSAWRRRLHDYLPMRGADLSRDVASTSCARNRAREALHL